MGACTRTGLLDPETSWIVDGKLIVTDNGNNRVLIWNTIPSTNNIPADVVLGQQDFTHCTANDINNDGTSDNASQNTLSGPAGVWSDGVRLVVLDTGNNRVVIWNSFPKSNFTPADIVLGQSNFTNITANNDNQDGNIDASASSRTLSGPYDGVYSNGIQLFIADSDNNRILVWNTFPTSSFAKADIVLGQSNFTNITANDDNQDGTPDVQPSARTLDFPTGIFKFSDKLIVADNNNRYLIYKSN